MKSTGSKAREGPPHAARRKTSFRARGEPVAWLTGLMLALGMTLIIAIVAKVVYHGSIAFWPRPIDHVTLHTGESFLGIPIRQEAYEPAAEIGPGTTGHLEGEAAPARRELDGASVRRLYRIGNREVQPQPYRWVSLKDIASITRPADAVLLERRAWGVWLGVPEGIVRRSESPIHEQTGQTAPSGVPRTPTEADGSGQNPSSVGTEESLASGPRDTLDLLRSMHPEAVSRFRLIERIKRERIGAINHQLEKERLHLRRAELARDGARGGMQRLLSPLPYTGLLVATGVLLVAALVVTRRTMLVAGARTQPLRGRLVCATLWLLACSGLLFTVTERPGAYKSVGEDAFAAAAEAHKTAVAGLQDEYATVLSRISAIEAKDARYRLIVVDPSTGRASPESQTALDEPMRISQLVRIVEANALSPLGKLKVFLDRWREFILEEPREANTEGGIFPVICGTIVLTMLLSVVVMPLGVVAALYLREYARQGLLTSAVRISVNNLAGVPSIVYGIFGLGFFCYFVGQYIDAGPQTPMPRVFWWLLIGSSAVLVLGAVWLGKLAKPIAGTPPSRRKRHAAVAAAVVWLVCALCAGVLVLTTPYFNGFHRDRLPSPTFGTKGLLWSSLTLALLTLPVVVVATEEALSSVPRSMREGSYGCGATQWQTVWRIVLPRAMPGILTGMILAMARGAGEVAPLMLVGAVKLAPELPVSGRFPFIHLERSFMHLGFHVYDVGFQSPDSEAARPLVWATALVLLIVVLVLTAAAIWIRSRLRRRFLGEAF